MPGLAPRSRGSFGTHDGHANPLMLLRALHAGLKMKGQISFLALTLLRSRRTPVPVIHGAFPGWPILEQRQARTRRRYRDLRVGIASGVACPNPPDARASADHRAAQAVYPYPTNKARQTKEGSVQIGSTSEDVGLDDRTTPDKISWLAERARMRFPPSRM